MHALSYARYGVYDQKQFDDIMVMDGIRKYRYPVSLSPERSSRSPCVYVAYKSRPRSPDGKWVRLELSNPTVAGESEYISVCTAIFSLDEGFLA
jgi:hypothetical protein